MAIDFGRRRGLFRKAETGGQWYLFWSGLYPGEELDHYLSYQQGDVIENSRDRFTIEKIRTTNRLNPPNTSVDYMYLHSDPGTQLYVVEGTYENLSSETVKMEDRLGIVWQDGTVLSTGMALDASRQRFFGKQNAGTSGANQGLLGHHVERRSGCSVLDKKSGSALATRSSKDRRRSKAGVWMFIALRYGMFF